MHVVLWFNTNNANTNMRVTIKNILKFTKKTKNNVFHGKSINIKEVVKPHQTYTVIKSIQWRFNSRYKK